MGQLLREELSTTMATTPHFLVNLWLLGQKPMLDME
tara:strand:+ start:574 stop:681 length:108 start_codon:yes stop_codon:yes gene_type:complete